MKLILRPLDAGWPFPPSPGERARFGADWGDTLDLLECEVTMVRRRDQADDPVILQIDAPESAFRLDGAIRANAAVSYPGVIVSFESLHGPLRYACDRYSEPSWARRGKPVWQDNVRAIALGLEALRAVDRYGISRDGQQYTGFAALGSGIPMAAATQQMTADEAERLLRRWRSGADHSDDWKVLYRRAAKELHPDAGGSHDEFLRLQEAYRLLGGDV